MGKRTKRQYIGSLLECVLKLILPLISVGVSIYGAVTSSHTIFYITILLQAANNIYEYCFYLSAYIKHIVLKSIGVIITSVLSVLSALLYFSGFELLGRQDIKILMIIFVCLPFINVGSEIYRMLRNNEF